MLLEHIEMCRSRGRTTDVTRRTGAESVLVCAVQPDVRSVRNCELPYIFRRSRGAILIWGRERVMEQAVWRQVLLDRLHRIQGAADLDMHIGRSGAAVAVIHGV